MPSPIGYLVMTAMPHRFGRPPSSTTPVQCTRQTGASVSGNQPFFTAGVERRTAGLMPHRCPGVTWRISLSSALRSLALIPRAWARLVRITAMSCASVSVKPHWPPIAGGCVSWTPVTPRTQEITAGPPNDAQRRVAALLSLTRIMF